MWATTQDDDATSYCLAVFIFGAAPHTLGFLACIVVFHRAALFQRRYMPPSTLRPRSASRRAKCEESSSLTTSQIADHFGVRISRTLFGGRLGHGHAKYRGALADHAEASALHPTLTQLFRRGLWFLSTGWKHSILVGVPGTGTATSRFMSKRGCRKHLMLC